MSPEPVPGWPASRLAEGPVWDAQAGQLVWVDTPGGMLHRGDPVRGECLCSHVGAPVSVAIPRRDGGWLLGKADGLYHWDADTGLGERWVAIEEDRPGSRLNDGACDPAGRLWVGTMAADDAPGEAGLYRVDPDGDVRKMLDGVTISNGLGWSPDGTRFYYVDPPTGRVETFAFDAADGELGARETFVTFAPDDGGPDGLAVDAEGAIWVAMWGGGSVRRYTADGDLERVVELPVENVTSCAFGGVDGRTLFITTAQSDRGTTTDAGDPGPGHLFRYETWVTGAPVTPFAG